MGSHGGERYKRPTVGLIALGTGNRLANSMGINSDKTRGLRHFFRGTGTPLPTFGAIFSPSAEVVIDEGGGSQRLIRRETEAEIYGAGLCSWGLYASMVADSDTAEYRKHGSKRF